MEYNGPAPELRINDRPADQYFSQDNPTRDTSAVAAFPYVDVHMFYIFFEVLKNAMRTSVAHVRRTSIDLVPAVPPIDVSFISATSLTEENERTVKVSDHGEGLSRDCVPRVWSYFYSTGKPGMLSIDSASLPKADYHFTDPFGGRGLGLPVARSLARYFDGDMDLHSIPRKGTDVYIYF